MKSTTETSRSLSEIGYPDNVFLRLGITLCDGNREQAKDDLEKLLAELPLLNVSILKLRYQNFLSITKIAEELGVSPNIVRRRKEGIIRQIMHTKAGINLCRKYRCQQLQIL